MANDPSVPRGRLKRLGKLVGMTTRMGAGLLVDGAKQLVGAASDPATEAAKTMIDTLGQLKGAAMKAGQTLSLFSEQLPPDAQKVLSKLFSQAPTVAYSEIAAQIEREMGKPPTELFASIDETPFAAASLGQVHRATLKTGEQVVVKVQYPGVESAMADDLRNMKSLIKSIGIAGPLLDRRDYAEELEREIAAELDYSRELKWAEAFREYLKPWPDLVVPRMYPELSSQRVLTMEWLEGEPLHAFSARTELTPAQRFRTGEQLVRALWAPFLFHRTIQGDAHPGNYLVMHNGRLGVLDFGCIKVLSESFWRANVEAVSHALFGTRANLVSSLKASGFQFGMPDERADALLRGLAEVVMSPLKGPFDFSDDALIRQVTALKRANPLELLRVKPPAEGLLFYRAMAGTRTNLSRLKASGDFRPFFQDAIPRAAAKT